MIKVLHVVGRMHYGGTETLIMNLYRHIDRERLQFDFLVYYANPGGYDDEIRQLGGNVYVIEKTLNPIKYLYKLAAFFSMHHEYDFVHVHILWLAWIYFPFAWKYKLKKIAHLHSDKIGKTGISLWMRRIFEKISIVNADVIFSCSKKAALCHKLDRRKTYLLKNGIDGKRFYYDYTIRKEVRAELKIGQKKVILCTARFDTNKNHTFLIDIMEKIVQKDKYTILVLIGEGPLEEDIRKKVRNLELESYVIFLGGRNDVARLLQSADAYVMPSFHEGLGIAYIESQAAGVKTFASDEAYTSEAHISDLLLHKSLGDGAKEWADWILTNISYERKNMEKELVMSGFEIIGTANALQSFYLKEKPIDDLFELALL